MKISAQMTDQAVLQAILSKGLELGSLDFKLSRRQLAEEAKVSDKTVTKATRRLRPGGSSPSLQLPSPAAK